MHFSFNNFISFFKVLISSIKRFFELFCSLNFFSAINNFLFNKFYSSSKAFIFINKSLTDSFLGIILLISSKINSIGIPIFILSFLLCVHPRCNPITFKLSNNIIGEPEDPPLVPTL